MVEVKIIDVTPGGLEGLIGCFLLISGDEAALIDVGPHSAADYVVEAVRSEGVRVSKLILTHIHLDHGGAAGRLVRDLGGPAVYVHPRGARHLEDPTKLWESSRSVLGPLAEFYGRPLPVPAANIRVPGDGDFIVVGDSFLRVVYTPGHASHHMSFYLEREGLLFAGDSAGISVSDGVDVIEIPTTPPPFKPDDYIASLHRMIELSPRRIALPHYGFKEDGVEYLRWHLDDIARWIRAVAEASGVESIDELMGIVAEKLPGARKALKARVGIISEFFYRGTIMGLKAAL